MKPLSGILLLDKPQGVTSAYVVRAITRIAGGARCGHLGTLDPMATGLLVALVGNALKLVPYYQTGTKHYVAEVSFGSSTDTYDSAGNVLETGPVPFDLRRRIEAALPQFRGTIQQVPPSYSAIRVEGRRLYELARKGREVTPPTRSITVHRIEALRFGENSVVLDIQCTSGTYIRSIAHDLGQAVSCPAHMSSLRRLGSAPFSIESATPFESIHAGLVSVPEAIQPVEWSLPQLPQIRLDEEESLKARNGVPLKREGLPDGHVLLLSPAGDAIAVGEAFSDRLEVRIKRVVIPLQE